jgi:hypothetical protein
MATICRMALDNYFLPYFLIYRLPVEGFAH